MRNQNHIVVLYYKRSLRNIEGNQDIVSILIWVMARTSLGTSDLNDYRQVECHSSWCYTNSLWRVM